MKKIITKSSFVFFSSLISSLVLFQLSTAQIKEYPFHGNSSFVGSVLANNNDTNSLDDWNALQKGYFIDLESTPLPKPIKHPCDELLNRTSEAFGEFYKCSISYARPYRFCEKCSRVYTTVVSVYEEIQHSALNTSRFNCKKYLLESDNSPVIQSAIANILTIWGDAYCDNCFGKSITDAYGNDTDLSNSTMKFLLLYRNLTDCITQKLVDGDPTHICDGCHELYKALNHHFNEIEKVSSSAVCMDVMDRMNSTRVKWSKDYNCSTVRPRETTLISSIVIMSCTVPGLFYTCAYAFSKGVQHVREKLARRHNARANLHRKYGSYESIDETQGINSPSVSSSSHT